MPSIGIKDGDTNKDRPALSDERAEGKKKMTKPSTTFHLLAGLAAGSCSAVLLQPVDLLKTRVQQSAHHSLWATFRHILASPKPVQQLWRGAIPSTIRTSVGSALYFTTLNTLRTRIAQVQTFATSIRSPNKVMQGGSKATNEATATSSALPQLTVLGNLTAGAVARASVGFVMMPITVIKVRYESNYYNYRSILGASRDIAAKEGLRGFFSGFGATALRDAPYAGLYVVVYEKGKGILSRAAARFKAATPDIAEDLNGVLPEAASNGTSKGGPSALTSAHHLTPSMSAAVNFTSSTVAASAATLITNPPDTIKTRLQVKPDKYKNSLQTLKLMLKEEGIRSFFDGLGLRMARKAMSSALAWTVYEEVIRRAEAKISYQA